MEREGNGGHKGKIFKNCKTIIKNREDIMLPLRCKISAKNILVMTREEKDENQNMVKLNENISRKFRLLIVILELPCEEPSSTL